MFSLCNHFDLLTNCLYLLYASCCMPYMGTLELSRTANKSPNTADAGSRIFSRQPHSGVRDPGDFTVLRTELAVRPEREDQPHSSRPRKRGRASRPDDTRTDFER